MAHQVQLTVCAPIRRGAVPALKQVLDVINADSAHNALIPFADIPTAHFGRLLIVEELSTGPRLLLMIDADAPLDRVVISLAERACNGLDLVFGLCEDYPPTGRRTHESRLAYLRSKTLGVDMFYVHKVGRTLQQVRQEALLRQALERFADHLQSQNGSSSLSALEVRDLIQGFVSSEPGLAWARTPPDPVDLPFQIGEAIHMFGVPLVLLVVAPLLIPAALLWLIVLRIRELIDPPPDAVLDLAQLREESHHEDFGDQNTISTLADIKPNWFWSLTATIFYGVADYTSRHMFNNGDLSGLKTVHFARFMRLDNGRKVLFTSYYDGSLEAYNNDFIDLVGWVLNAMFGNQVNYPKTRFLFFDGASDERGFKSFLRGHQIPTQVWYSAYPRLSAINVDNNALLRAGLSGRMSLSEAEAWLRRL
jgi:hypothetical protein